MRTRRNPDGATIVGTLAVIGAVGLGAWALFFRRPATAARPRQSRPIPATPTAEQAAMIDLIATQQLRDLGYPPERYYNDPYPISSSDPTRELTARGRAMAAWRSATHPELEGRGYEQMMETIDRDYAIRFGLPL